MYLSIYLPIYLSTPSSFLSDGATACLLATESRAKQLGLAGKALIRSYAYASQVAS